MATNVERIFVVENGEIGFIRDNLGVTVTFNSLEELTRCTGIDFSGKFYIGYEPDINFFTDSEDPSFTPEDIPYAPYEALIDDIATLQARKDDPSYGVPEEEGKAALEALRQEERVNEYQNRYLGLTGDLFNADRDNKKRAKALRKETKGTATQEDIDLLDAADLLDDQLDILDTDNDALELYIEDPLRTLEELRTLDVTDEQWWT